MIRNFSSLLVDILKMLGYLSCSSWVVEFVITSSSRWIYRLRLFFGVEMTVKGSSNRNYTIWESGNGDTASFYDISYVICVQENIQASTFKNCFIKSLITKRNLSRSRSHNLLNTNYIRNVEKTQGCHIYHFKLHHCYWKIHYMSLINEFWWRLPISQKGDGVKKNI